MVINVNTSALGKSDTVKQQKQNKNTVYAGNLNKNNENSYISQKKEYAQKQAMKQSITGAKLEQLKSQDMLNANNAADSIMDALSDEILGTLLQDSLDKMEEKQKEEEEKKEEAVKKEEEQQKQLDNADDNQKMQEELLQAAVKSGQEKESIQNKQQGNTTVEQAQESIVQVLKENNLIDEDLKGIKIDFNF